METTSEPCTDVECARAARRQGNRLAGDELRPVMVSDPAKQISAQEQQLRQRYEVFEGPRLRTPKLPAVDHRRKIRDGDSAARITTGVHHAASFPPVSSAG